MNLLLNVQLSLFYSNDVIVDLKKFQLFSGKWLISLKIVDGFLINCDVIAKGGVK